METKEIEVVSHKEETMPNITLRDLTINLYNKISDYIQEKDIAPAEAKDLADAIYTLTKVFEELEVVSYKDETTSMRVISQEDITRFIKYLDCHLHEAIGDKALEL